MDDYISASYLPQVAMCEASGRLQRRSFSGDAAERGRAIHAWVAHNIDPIEGYEQPEAFKEELQGINLEGLLQACRKQGVPGSLYSEVGYFFTPRTWKAKKLGRVLGRDYGKVPKGAIPMTLDILFLSEDGKLAIITDIKTGRIRRSAADSWQLRSHALAVFAETGVEAVIVQHAYLRDDGGWDLDARLFEENELNELNGELNAMLKAIPKAEPRPSKEACEYCPCYHACPATTALVRSITSPGHRWPTSLDKAGAADAWVKLQAYEKALKEVRGQLEELARREPFELPDGKVVREVVESREYASGKTLEIAAGIVGASVAANAATTSKKALEEACAAAGLNPKQAIEELRKAGAFTMKETKTVKAVKL